MNPTRRTSLWQLLWIAACRRPARPPLLLLRRPRGYRQEAEGASLPYRGRGRARADQEEQFKQGYPRIPGSLHWDVHRRLPLHSFLAVVPAAIAGGVHVVTKDGTFLRIRMHLEISVDYHKASSRC